MHNICYVYFFSVFVNPFNLCNIFLWTKNNRSYGYQCRCSIMNPLCPCLPLFYCPEKVNSAPFSSVYHTSQDNIRVSVYHTSQGDYSNTKILAIQETPKVFKSLRILALILLYSSTALYYCTLPLQYSSSHNDNFLIFYILVYDLFCVARM